MSAAYERVGGYRRDELVGRNTLDLFWVDTDERRRALELLRADGKIREFVWRLRRKSGEIRWVTSSAERLDYAGEPCLLSVTRDITELRRAQQELARSEARFRSVLQQTTDAVFCYEYDPPIETELPLPDQVERLYDGVLVECNDVAARTYGARRPAEVLGQQLPVLFKTSPGGLDDLFRAFVENGYRSVDQDATETPDQCAGRGANRHSHRPAEESDRGGQPPGRDAAGLG